MSRSPLFLSFFLFYLISQLPHSSCPDDKLLFYELQSKSSTFFLLENKKWRKRNAEKKFASMLHFFHWSYFLVHAVVKDEYELDEMQLRGRHPCYKTQLSQVRFLTVLRFFRENFDVAQMQRGFWLEESGQNLLIVGWIHLVPRKYFHSNLTRYMKTYLNISLVALVVKLRAA